MLKDFVFGGLKQPTVPSSLLLPIPLGVGRFRLGGTGGRDHRIYLAAVTYPVRGTAVPLVVVDWRSRKMAAMLVAFAGELV